MSLADVNPWPGITAFNKADGVQAFATSVNKPSKVVRQRIAQPRPA
jgi:hypothetical protein